MTAEDGANDSCPDAHVAGGVIGAGNLRFVASVGATDAGWGTGFNGSFEATDAGWLAQETPTMVVSEKGPLLGVRTNG